MKIIRSAYNIFLCVPTWIILVSHCDWASQLGNSTLRCCLLSDAELQCDPQWARVSLYLCLYSGDHLHWDSLHLQLAFYAFHAEIVTNEPKHKEDLVLSTQFQVVMVPVHQHNFWITTVVCKKKMSKSIW